MKKWIGMLVMMGLMVMACSNGEEAAKKKAEQDKSTQKTLALLKKIKVSDSTLPEGLVEKGIAYVAKFAALGEKEAAAWEKSARFPDSIMPHQSRNKEFKNAYEALIEACQKEVACQKVSASMGLGHFTIMGPNLSLKKIFSKKIPVPEGNEGLEIYRLNNEGKDTVVFEMPFRGTAYEHRGKAFLLLILN